MACSSAQTSIAAWTRRVPDLRQSLRRIATFRKRSARVRRRRATSQKSVWSIQSYGASWLSWWWKWYHALAAHAEAPIRHCPRVQAAVRSALDAASHAGFDQGAQGHIGRYEPRVSSRSYGRLPGGLVTTVRCASCRADDDTCRLDSRSRRASARLSDSFPRNLARTLGSQAPYLIVFVVFRPNVVVHIHTLEHVADPSSRTRRTPAVQRRAACVPCVGRDCPLPMWSIASASPCPLVDDDAVGAFDVPQRLRQPLRRHPVVVYDHQPLKGSGESNVGWIGLVERVGAEAKTTHTSFVLPWPRTTCSRRACGSRMRGS